MPKQQKDGSRRHKLGPVRQFIVRHSEPLWRDDLLVRVIFLLTGTMFGGLGITLLVAGTTTHDLDGQMLGRLFFFAVAIVLTAYGGFMLSRCILSVRSRTARRLDRFLPDSPGLEESALLVLLIYLPAVLLTLLLRWIGIKGQRIDWDRVGPPGTK
jgi:hypothetical protein